MQDPHLFIRVQGTISGPYTQEQLRALRDAGGFRRFHEISADQRDWQTAWCLTDLFPAAIEPTICEPLEPAPLPEQPTPPPTMQAAARLTPDIYAVTEPIDNRLPGGKRSVAEWYYLDDADRRQGPVRAEQLFEFLQRGDLDGATPVWKPGMADWVELQAADTGLSVPLARLASAARQRPREYEPLAVAALICSLLWLGGLGSLAGSVLGGMALWRIQQTRGRGQALAVAALAIGLLYLVLTPILIVLLFKAAAAGGR
jgi:hypothetical protein